MPRRSAAQRKRWHFQRMRVHFQRMRSHFQRFHIQWHFQRFRSTKGLTPPHRPGRRGHGAPDSDTGPDAPRANRSRRGPSGGRSEQLVKPTGQMVKPTGQTNWSNQRKSIPNRPAAASLSKPVRLLQTYGTAPGFDHYHIPRFDHSQMPGFDHGRIQASTRRQRLRRYDCSGRLS
jgi:hypothetical protein